MLLPFLKTMLLSQIAKNGLKEQQKALPELKTLLIV